MLLGLTELTGTMREAAPIESALAVNLDVPTHHCLVPWMLGLIIILVLIVILLVIIIVVNLLDLLLLIDWLELEELLGHLVDSVEVKFFLAVGEGALVPALAVPIPLIPLAQDCLRVGRNVMFLGVLLDLT